MLTQFWLWFVAHYAVPPRALCGGRELGAEKTLVHKKEAFGADNSGRGGGTGRRGGGGGGGGAPQTYIMRRISLKVYTSGGFGSFRRWWRVRLALGCGERGRVGDAHELDQRA